MARSAEELLKLLIGGLVLTNAQLGAQLEAALEQVPKPKKPKGPASDSGEGPQ